MQVVVEIDDNLYTRLFDNGVDNYDDAVDMAKAIRNGIPLPKNHKRLIEANDKLLYAIYAYATFDEAYDILDNAPTIIEADEAESEVEV